MVANTRLRRPARCIVARARIQAAGICFVAIPIGLAATVDSAMASTAEHSPSVEELSELSLDELANVEIISVSKTAQPLNDAAAAIYVITHEDIVRSGATRIPEILRLAPNLQVARIDSTNYAISARGFNGTVADKLLVLIDGRTVYAPFFSGVFWDGQDVPVENIERIEVISGPGATLWGANAVNGVINIISRKASDTPGGLLELGYGNIERRGSLQYGGKARDDLSYRAYVQGFSEQPSDAADGSNAKDGWHKKQTGFRTDWTPSSDLFTLQGDVYNGAQDQLVGADGEMVGGNLLGRWNRALDAGATLQVQLYYDYFERTTPTAADYLHTYDLDIQHSFAWGERQQIVWGGGYRIMRDRFPITATGPTEQRFDPERRTLTLANIFGQDNIALTSALKLALGLKLEDDPYSHVEPLPSARLSWKASDKDLWWAAISRAIRAPSRLDEDFVQTQNGAVVLQGGDFKAEKLTAYEIGYRAQPSPRATLSVSTFYNVYKDLRSFETSPQSIIAPYPLTIQNRLEGETYGFETWASYRINDWWNISAGYNWLREHLHFEPGSSVIGGVDIAGNDPNYQFSLRSSMNFSSAVTLDFDVRKIAALPDPPSASYTELNARLGWAVSNTFDIALVGANLLHPQHEEFGSTFGSLQLGAVGVETARSVYIDTHWRF